MKKVLKSKTFLLSILLLSSAATQAQDIDLVTPVSNFTDQIKTIFPYIAGAIFLIVVMVNLGHFVKENGDWKKGLTNIFIYAAIVGMVAGLFSVISNVQL